LTLVVLAAARVAEAQSPPLTLPQPSQAASVSQTVGLTEITITYHRPRVQGREIWGKLVPYGEVWRAGANENTTIAFSTPVEIEGHALPAGRYGFHTLPSAGNWQLIFSAVDSNWGSFAYDAKEDVLRVEVKPEAAPFEEALAYTFDDATARETTIALRWEKLRVPFKVAVDTPEIVYQSLKRELRGLPQFFWQPWNQAATTLLTSKVHLDEAMVWVDRSIAIQKNFANSFTKARLLGERGDAAGAKKLMDEALPGANEAELNAYGYQLLGGGSAADAVAIFRETVKRHPESWNAHDSLAEGLVALGKTDEAVATYRKALAMAPEAQKGRIQGILDGLGKKP
jgi:tetratricopeptide (TPR) repeat protein